VVNDLKEKKNLAGGSYIGCERRISYHKGATGIEHHYLKSAWRGKNHFFSGQGREASNAGIFGRGTVKTLQ